MFAQDGWRDGSIWLLGSRRSLGNGGRLTIQTFPHNCLSVFRRKPQPEPVALESSKNVKMHVEDFLPGRLAIGEKEVDALGFQSRLPNSSRQPLYHSEQMLAYRGIEIRQVFGVRERDDQQVTRPHISQSWSRPVLRSRLLANRRGIA